MSLKISRRRRVLEILISVFVLLSIFIWVEGLLHKKVEPGFVESEGEKELSGNTYKITATEIPILVEAPGKITAHEEAIISSRVMGVIEKINVREGDRVEKGQLLAVISAPELELQSVSAAGGFRSAEAALEQAKRDFERMDFLYQRQAASKVEWERAKTALSQAEANLTFAKGGAGSASAIAKYTNLLAPFDGLVAERLLDQGTLASPGIPILKIVDNRSFRIEVTFDEKKISKLDLFDSAHVIIDAIKFETDVSISRIVPASDPRSHTVIVQTDIPQIQGITSGQFARLVLKVGSQIGIAIPESAVIESGGLTFVKVASENGRSVIRYVRLGRKLKNGMVEVQAGLEAGEEVLLQR